MERRCEDDVDRINPKYENDRGVEVRYRVCSFPEEQKLSKYDYKKSFRPSCWDVESKRCERQQPQPGKTQQR